MFGPLREGLSKVLQIPLLHSKKVITVSLTDRYHFFETDADI